MVRVEIQKWGQSLDDPRRLAIEAKHPRTRERLLALSLIADGTHNTTSWAVQSGRQDDTVLKWVHDDNAQGPEALTYRRTGGPPPLLHPAKSGRSSRPSSPPSRSTTGCPATAGP
jgi:hypothetical protein